MYILENVHHLIQYEMRICGVDVDLDVDVDLCNSANIAR